MVFALTLRSFTSTLLPQRTIGTCSQTRTRSPMIHLDASPFCRESKLTMPVGYVFVRDTRRHVEHNDTALAVNIVAIAETTKFLLPRGIPNIELNSSVVL